MANRVYELFSPLKVIVALLTSVAWLRAVILIDRSEIGWHSTPGIWTAVFGFPGVLVVVWTEEAASWIHGAAQSAISPSESLYLIGSGVNFFFYLSMIGVATSLFRRFSKGSSTR